MNVSDIKSRTVKTYTLTVQDGEIRPQPHSRRGGHYRVSRVEVVKQDGNVYQVTFSGPVIKKDGTESLNGYTERLYGKGFWPTWLHSIVKGLA